MCIYLNLASSEATNDKEIGENFHLPVKVEWWEIHANRSYSLIQVVRRPMTPVDLTLSDFGRSNSRSLLFESLYLERKRRYVTCYY